jgi:glycosyltransferase involved in cell wall biosynthesis
MDLKERTICLLFRQPGRFFSLERIFRQLGPLMEKYIRVTSWSAAYSAFTPGKLLTNILAARKNRADVYHVTGDIHYVVLALPRRRTLLTIHDCVFLYTATGIKRKLLKWFLLDMPVRRCRLITTISEATKRDILQHTGCSPDKLVVIPDPIADSIYYAPAVFNEQQPVILFVGTTSNKNLLLTAAALKNISCRVDIIGPLSAEQQQALEDNHIHYQPYSGLTDEEMASRYAEADIILFPSTFEGFGLPIVEGQKAGRPVITSNLSPVKETAGGAACLVDPWDPASIRDGVLRVIRDADYRQQLVGEGFRNITRFSPEAIAKQYLECYEKILNS